MKFLCKKCNSPCVQFGFSKFICVNEKCEELNLIQSDEIDS